MSGLFFSVELMPEWLRVASWVMPTTHAVALMQGVGDGAGWGPHWVDAVALVVLFVGYTALSMEPNRS